MRLMDKKFMGLLLGFILCGMGVNPDCNPDLFEGECRRWLQLSNGKAITWNKIVNRGGCR